MRLLQRDHAGARDLRALHVEVFERRQAFEASQAVVSQVRIGERDIAELGLTRERRGKSVRADREVRVKLVDRPGAAQPTKFFIVERLRVAEVRFLVIVSGLPAFISASVGMPATLLSGKPCNFNSAPLASNRFANSPTGSRPTALTGLLPTNTRQSGLACCKSSTACSSAS